LRLVPGVEVVSDLCLVERGSIRLLQAFEGIVILLLTMVALS